MLLLKTIFTLLLTTSSVLALPTSVEVQHEKRTAAGLLTNLATISTNVASLTVSAKAYTGTLLQSLALGIAVNTLQTNIKTATTTTTGSVTFTTAETASVVSAVGVLTPKIVALVGELNAKASIIETAGFNTVVASALLSVTADADALFVAVAAKVATAADSATITTYQASVDAAFAEAQVIFA